MRYQKLAKNETSIFTKSLLEIVMARGHLVHLREKPKRLWPEEDIKRHEGFESNATVELLQVAIFT